jgi:AcrR family transcriptional regulator
VQISAIAEAAGIVAGILYRYFPAKINLMVEMISLIAQR